MGKLALNINKKTWDKAREKHKEGYSEDIELEPGRYDGKIVKVDVADTDKGKQAIFRIEIPNAVGDKPGTIGIWFVLEDEERLVWLLRFLEKLGYDPSALNPDDLGDLFDDVAKNQPEVRIRASKKGDYTNYKVDQVLTTSSAVAAAPVEEEVPAPAAKGKTAPAAATKAGATKTTAKPAKEEEPVASDEEEVAVEEEPAAAEGEVDLKVGLKLKATIQGEIQPVEITAIHEEEQKVTVKVIKTNKQFKIGLNKLSI